MNQILDNKKVIKLKKINKNFIFEKLDKKKYEIFYKIKLNLNEKKKILIVGGTGFIGYHLAKICLKKKFLVTSLSFRKVKNERYLKKVKYIKCDISNQNNLKKNIKENFDYVVNL